jgi:hypothetical protein
MSSKPMEFLPVWAYISITLLFIGIPVWVAWKIGVRWRDHGGEDESGSVGITIGALLSLLGFLLAFTFGMANNRFEERRQAVMEEANAIGTAYLRADLLSPEKQLQAKALLTEYVGIRVRAIEPHETERVSRKVSDQIINGIIADSERIHSVLWNISVDASDETPTAITGYFVASINDVIDIHAVRVVLGTKATIPVEIWMCLYVLAAFGLAGSAFHASFSGAKSIYPTVALVVAFSSILTIITDLDNPLHGMLQTDQSPLLGLLNAMSPPA